MIRRFLIPRKNPEFEINGLIVEALGIMCVLLAAVWQFAFTDWFDRTYFEQQFYTQESVNIAILASLATMESAPLLSNPKMRDDSLFESSQRARNAISTAIDDRDRRLKLQRGQAAGFKLVRVSLFVIGSFCIAVGKIMVLLHKKTRAN